MSHGRCGVEGRGAVTLRFAVTERVDASYAAAQVAPAGDLVFISYSRADTAWLRVFEVMLNPLARNRGLEVWSDDRMVVGEEWRPQLADAINRASLALVLVSGELLASPFIMKEELPALVERGVPLV